MDSLKGIRIVSATIIGLITLAGVTTYGCNDFDGVASWERCTSFLGNPIPEYHPLISLVVAIAIGVLAWWLLRFTPLDPKQSPRSASWRYPR